MRSAPHYAWTRITREETGVTLIELMVTAVILAVVLAAILAVSDTTAKLAPRDDERALLMQETRTGLAAMSREVRQATAVGTVSSTSLAFSIGSRSITYACTTPQPGVTGRVRCTRREGTGAARTVLSHVLNSANNVPVFTRAGRQIGFTVQVAAAGDRVQGHKHTLTLTDGAYVRNLP